MTTLVDNLIAGYTFQRALDLDALEMFLVLRACTCIGWIVPRREEPEATERCARFIRNGCLYVVRWLDSVQYFSTPIADS